MIVVDVAVDLEELECGLLVRGNDNGMIHGELNLLFNIIERILDSAVLHVLLTKRVHFL